MAHFIEFMVHRYVYYLGNRLPRTVALLQVRTQTVALPVLSLLRRTSHKTVNPLNPVASFSVCFFILSQRWRILVTDNLFWCMQPFVALVHCMSIFPRWLAALAKMNVFVTKANAAWNWIRLRWACLFPFAMEATSSVWSWFFTNSLWRCPRCFVKPRTSSSVVRLRYVANACPLFLCASQPDIYYCRVHICL